MPKYYCEYCGIYLTHSSPSGRKQHSKGRKHISSKVEYYSQFLSEANRNYFFLPFIHFYILFLFLSSPSNPFSSHEKRQPIHQNRHSPSHDGHAQPWQYYAWRYHIPTFPLYLLIFQVHLTCQLSTSQVSCPVISISPCLACQVASPAKEVCLWDNLV